MLFDLFIVFSLKNCIVKAKWISYKNYYKHTFDVVMIEKMEYRILLELRILMFLYPSHDSSTLNDRKMSFNLNKIFYSKKRVNVSIGHLHSERIPFIHFLHTTQDDNDYIKSSHSTDSTGQNSVL